MLGTIITVAEYLKTLDEQLAAYDTDMGSHAGFLRHGLGTADPSQHSIDHTNWLDRDPAVQRARWLHLAHAKISSPGESAQRVPLWRGRTASVDGWSLLPPKHPGHR
ncbi:hypothetical protein [Nocardioides daphniae]|uniref:Uncharacterized protein n=1 Tax=Nocardioides daphniae TaxID=402297 RepID=A0A4P7U882_9ACTN|nr:hypothetical protein [Nocardioides daphniae]QCC76352.1 hypothetical protein E2C04_02470 [Nocardioides daphniae]